jgi:hypothetical protein
MSKPLKCPLCEYSTDRTYNFKRHVATKHDSCEIVPQQNINLPQQNINLPQQNINLPQQFINLPQQFINLPQQFINLEENTHDTPCLSEKYSCELCSKSFGHKWVLDRHKKVCKGVASSLECPTCGKKFAYLQSKHRHMKICKGHSTVLTVPPPATQILSQTNNNNNYTSCSVNNGTVNNTVNINVNCFGQENMDHITNAFKDARLHEFNGKGIFNLIKSVHFNPELPENHNIRKHDNKYCKVFDDGEWMLRSLKSAISDLVHRYKQVLCERLINVDYKKLEMCEETWMQIWQNLMKFDKNKNPADFYRTIRDVMALMENLERLYEKELELIQTSSVSNDDHS